jgi:hypothetical protein
VKSPSVKSVRCAIYTRVSTDQGLDQEFNSLDAQYEAASAYIRSQAHAGWTLIRSRYDDGGYSGGSIPVTGDPSMVSLIFSPRYWAKRQRRASFGSIVSNFCILTANRRCTRNSSTKTKV